MAVSSSALGISSSFFSSDYEERLAKKRSALDPNSIDSRLRYNYSRLCQSTRVPSSLEGSFYGSSVAIPRIIADLQAFSTICGSKLNAEDRARVQESTRILAQALPLIQKRDEVSSVIKSEDLDNYDNPSAPDNEQRHRAWVDHVMDQAAENIRALKPGEKTLLPAGIMQHTVICEVSRTTDGSSYTFSLIDTGGVNSRDANGDCPIRDHVGLTLEEVTNKKFLHELGLLDITMIHRELPIRTRAGCLYALVTNLTNGDETRVKKDRKITYQANNDCYLAAPMGFVESTLGKPLTALFKQLQIARADADTRQICANFFNLKVPHFEVTVDPENTTTSKSACDALRYLQEVGSKTRRGIATMMEADLTVGIRRIKDQLQTFGAIQNRKFAITMKERIVCILFQCFSLSSCRTTYKRVSERISDFRQIQRTDTVAEERRTGKTRESLERELALHIGRKEAQKKLKSL